MERTITAGSQPLEDASLIAFTPCGHWWVVVALTMSHFGFGPRRGGPAPPSCSKLPNQARPEGSACTPGPATSGPCAECDMVKVTTSLDNDHHLQSLAPQRT